jgi:hypothetical protein
MLKVYRICIVFLLINISVAYANSMALKNIFDSQSYHYAIHYPSQWKVHDHGDGVVVFKPFTDSKTFINIQTIYTKKAGGHYATVKDLMDDFKSEVPRHAAGVTFFARQPIVLQQPNGEKLVGESITLTFKDHLQWLKHWQVMLVNQSGRVFQAFGYRAPIRNFDANYALATEMLQTWVIE